MRPARTAVLILALILTASIGLSARAAPRDPVPLGGTPLGDETGLRLLVADNPPFVLDVDAGKVAPSGIPAMSRGALWVVPVGGRAAAVVARSVWERADIYSARGREARVSRLGTGVNVWPAGDGRSVWVESVTARSRCALRRQNLQIVLFASLKPRTRTKNPAYRLLKEKLCDLQGFPIFRMLVGG